MYDTYLMRKFLDMPLPNNYEDRLWITKIIDHMSYEEAFLRRHEIPFRPDKKDRTANIHSTWVYKVEWELFNGEFIETWEIEDHLVHLKELDIYKEKYIHPDHDTSRIYSRCRWTDSEDDDLDSNSNDQTITSRACSKS
ncbi:unnamed protein product [Nippostrongylus brasiliensis]|uniref:Chromo domain-containing protein n=1 Tax=Nippostrongylus brasiliensis TaxID=27835 RepID=A0A0N4YBY5_NIPBR|nr:hypothetical protein Q1695_005628 [Nippostrongylus brasiliensis]VDL77610.1 unnamed protein product [Nippostrongylus brasiliensis]